VEVAALEGEVSWWLDLYRWEFALSERELLGPELGRVLNYFDTVGALRGGVPEREHPLLGAVAGILENFREAYLITARTIASQQAWPISQEVLLSRVRRGFVVAQLLGEVSKPEANSVITHTCALNRLAELKYVSFRTDGRAGKDRRVMPGPAHDQLLALAERLGPMTALP
jgi:hypothetical protein